MSEQGAHAPRRALPPVDDDLEDAFGPDDPDDTPPPPLRRALLPDDEPGTPVPPPAPVLPPSEAAAPASAGRRYSASDAPTVPSGALPRRSAVSPTASSVASPVSPTGGRPTAASAPGPHPSLTPIGDSTAGDPTAGDAAVGAPRPRRRGLVAAGVGLSLVALVTAGLLVARPLGVGPFASPSPTVDVTAVYLLQPGDLTGFGAADTVWQAATTAEEVTADTPQPRCFVPSADQDTRPRSTLVRTLTAATGEAGAVLHQVDTYATVEEASTAYTTRLAELGDCTRTVSWIMAGYTVTGLSDDAVGVNLMVQGAAPEFHTIVLSRTGTMVNIVDTTRSVELFGADVVVGALATVSARQCSAAGGTCPSGAQVAPAAAPLATPPGWLAPVDLPRLTPGTGVWRGTDIPELNVTGTQCEGVALKEVADATSEQRTYLLGDDSNVPATFGLDEVVYTFPTEQAAIDFAVKVIDATDQCPARTPTATVTRSTTIEAPSASGAGFTVVRQTNAETQARFRTGIVRSGGRVAYLLANPSSQLDFDDAQWAAVVTRAGERLTQMP